MKQQALTIAWIALVAVSPLLAVDIAEAKKHKTQAVPAPGTAATGGSEFDSGYRAGVAKAAQDVGKFNANQINGVDANNPPPCPLPGNKPYCDGWEKGYSDKAVDDLD